MNRPAPSRLASTVLAICRKCAANTAGKRDQESSAKGMIQIAEFIRPPCRSTERLPPRSMAIFSSGTSPLPGMFAVIWKTFMPRPGNIVTERNSRVFPLLVGLRDIVTTSAPPTCGCVAARNGTLCCAPRLLLPAAKRKLNAASIGRHVFAGITNSHLHALPSFGKLTQCGIFLHATCI